MEFIDRNTAKNIVGKALKEVADFSDDFENYTFDQFHPFHSKVFLNSLKILVNKTECSDQSGNITNEEYFDIDLSIKLQKTWNSMKDCTDYVAGSHYRVLSPTKRIELP